MSRIQLESTSVMCLCHEMQARDDNDVVRGGGGVAGSRSDPRRLECPRRLRRVISTAEYLARHVPGTRMESGCGAVYDLHVM